MICPKSGPNIGGSAEPPPLHKFTHTFTQMGVSPPTGIWQMPACQIQLPRHELLTTHPPPSCLKHCLLRDYLENSFCFQNILERAWLSNSPLLGISTVGRMALYGKCADLNNPPLKTGFLRKWAYLRPREYGKHRHAKYSFLAMNYPFDILRTRAGSVVVVLCPLQSIK